VKLDTYAWQDEDYGNATRPGYLVSEITDVSSSNIPLIDDDSPTPNHKPSCPLFLQTPLDSPSSSNAPYWNYLVSDFRTADGTHAVPWIAVSAGDLSALFDMRSTDALPRSKDDNVRFQFTPIRELEACFSETFDRAPTLDFDIAVDDVLTRASV
jgi:hypothetical protein